MAIKIKKYRQKKCSCHGSKKILYIDENKLIMNASPFFYEWVRLIRIIQNG